MRASGNMWPRASSNSNEWNTPISTPWRRANCYNWTGADDWAAVDTKTPSRRKVGRLSSLFTKQNPSTAELEKKLKVSEESNKKLKEQVKNLSRAANNNLIKLYKSRPSTIFLLTQLRKSSQVITDFINQALTLKLINKHRDQLKKIAGRSDKIETAVYVRLRNHARYLYEDSDQDFDTWANSRLEEYSDDSIR